MTRIEEVVHRDAEQYWEYDRLPGVSPSTFENKYPCGTDNRMEEILVSMTAHWFVNSLGVKFNQYVYAPNKFVEKECGFDLSIGQVNDLGPRLRIQSKVVDRWADVYGQVSFGEGVSKDAHRERDQIRKLVGLFGAFPKVNDPFLVIYNCHCNCEYRRMGSTLENTLVLRIRINLSPKKNSTYSPQSSPLLIPCRLFPC